MDLFDPYDLTPISHDEWDKYWPTDWEGIDNFQYVRYRCCGKPQFAVWHPGIGLVCCLCRKPYKRKLMK